MKVMSQPSHLPWGFVMVRLKGGGGGGGGGVIRFSPF